MVDGPCDKDDANSMTGAVVGLWDHNQLARSLAHEVGHYLGLEHENGDPGNLMCQTKYADSIANSVELINDQGNDIKDHCSIESGC